MFPIKKAEDFTYVEFKILAIIAKGISSIANTGKVFLTDAHEKGMKLNLEKEFKFAKPIMNNRNIIHKLDLFTYIINFTLDPIYSKDGIAIGTFGIRFDMDKIKENIVKKFLNSNKKKNFKIFAAHIKNKLLRFPNDIFLVKTKN
jgi:hypothetical protein